MLEFAVVKRDTLGLVAWILIVFAAGAIGSQFKPGEWYQHLRKPSWNPPAWVFAPVWTLLYALMSIAAWWVWRKWGFAGARFALGFFLLQLALNALWSPVFFGLHLLPQGVVVIVVLWIAIAATTVLFFRKEPLAGWLLIPYLLWVAFAGVLNFSLWRLNR